MRRPQAAGVADEAGFAESDDEDDDELDDSDDDEVVDSDDGDEPFADSLAAGSLVFVVEPRLSVL